MEEEYVVLTLELNMLELVDKTGIVLSVVAVGGADDLDDFGDWGGVGLSTTGPPEGSCIIILSLRSASASCLNRFFSVTSGDL